MRATSFSSFPQNEHRIDPAEPGLSRPIVRWYLATEAPKCGLDARHVPRLVHDPRAVHPLDAPPVVRGASDGSLQVLKRLGLSDRCPAHIATSAFARTS